MKRKPTAGTSPIERKEDWLKGFPLYSEKKTDWKNFPHRVKIKPTEGTSPTEWKEDWPNRPLLFCRICTGRCFHHLQALDDWDVGDGWASLTLLNCAACPPESLPRWCRPNPDSWRNERCSCAVGTSDRFRCGCGGCWLHCSCLPTEIFTSFCFILV